MITIEREKLKRVVETLQYLHGLVWSQGSYLLEEDSGGAGWVDMDCKNAISVGLSALAQPPLLVQREWVDLTDEEFDELEYRFARYELCRAIGAALRSKNT